MGQPRTMRGPSGTGSEPLPDEATLVAAAKHDLRAFTPLYRHYVPQIYAYCLARLGSHEAAEDATSRTFERALHRLASCREEAFRGWLFTIAMHVVADHYRSRWPPASLAPLELAGTVPEPDHLVEEVVVANEAANQLYRWLQTLPPDQRRVLELRAAGLRGGEIAALLGRSHAAVRMLQLRAVRHLRGVMAQDAPQGRRT
ncbi:MAG: sigma-70 family RNA polymerase sigma factor [Thermomicrobiales bacterium]|nr:sigma-70 family RNA polymerase sigma factor [Thermomicrobiales bacterium]